jgi:hypothetical protein
MFYELCREFYTPVSLGRHFMSCHVNGLRDDQQFECSICSKKLTHKNHLRNHAETVHGVNTCTEDCRSNLDLVRFKGRTCLRVWDPAFGTQVNCVLCIFEHFPKAYKQCPRSKRLFSSSPATRHHSKLRRHRRRNGRGRAEAAGA